MSGLEDLPFNFVVYEQVGHLLHNTNGFMSLSSRSSVVDTLDFTTGL